jgi:hypothetical protein
VRDDSQLPPPWRAQGVVEDRIGADVKGNRTRVQTRVRTRVLDRFGEWLMHSAQRRAVSELRHPRVVWGFGLDKSEWVRRISGCGAMQE